MCVMKALLHVYIGVAIYCTSPVYNLCFLMGSLGSF